MTISVVICTRNRAESLQKTLESLLVPSNLLAEDWELLLVDNSSTDATSKVCQELARKFPMIVRVLMEKKVGKSHAMNTAITAAKGDLLALTDDDVQCAPNYIWAIRNTFATYPADGAQGRVVVDFEGGRPDWMNDLIEGMMSSRDFGADVLEWKDNLTACNMVVRAEVFQKIGGFSPELGAGAIGFMEDSEFSRRMRAAGFRSIYSPQIFVRHCLPKERLRKSVWLRNCFRQGCSEAFILPLPAPIWRFSAYVLKQFALKQVQALWHQLRGRPAVAMYTLCEGYHLLGFLWGHWRFSRGVPQELSPPQLKMGAQARTRTDN